jgi:hypothetical protein
MPLQARTRRVQRLIVLVWALDVLPHLYDLIRTGHTTLAVNTSSATATGTGRTIETALFFLTVGYALLMILQGGKQRTSSGLLLLVLPWMAMLFSQVQVSGRPTKAAILYPAVVAAIWLSRPHARALAAIGWITLGTAAASLALFLAIPSIGQTPQSGGAEAKAVFGSTLMSGIFTHPNTLGVALALGLPTIALMDVSRRHMAYAFTFVCACIVLSGSRTSMIAAGCTLLLFVVAYRNRRYRLDRQVLGWLPGALVGGILIGGPYLAFSTSDPTRFAGRGQIWMGSIAYWKQHVWRGNGPNFYGVVGTVNNNLTPLAFHGHNMVVHLLTTGGLLAGAGYAVLMIACAREGVRALPEFGWKVHYVAVLGLIGWLEVATDFLDIGQLDYAVWPALAVLLLTGVEFHPWSAPPVEGNDELQHSAFQRSGALRT